MLVFVWKQTDNQLKGHSGLVESKARASPLTAAAIRASREGEECGL
ncbi:MAG: hypothetical protein QOJ42_5108 [Acidobacteriaceae bacterium]|nr:hypothetical protein [Acidobacteriaceae bacterium]